MSFTKDFIDTLKRTDLKSLTIDASELLIDSSLDNGIIKDIPLVGSVYKMYSIGSTVKARLFEKQIYAFLYELKDIPAEKRDRLIQKLETKKGFEQSFGDEIIVMLDQFSNIRKSSICARFYKQLLYENINVVTFRRLSFILKGIFDGDIDHLAAFYEGDKLSKYTQSALESLGLITVERRAAKIGKSVGYLNSRTIEKPQQNDLGKLFCELM
jgi:hypothetical protein